MEERYSIYHRGCSQSRLKDCKILSRFQRKRRSEKPSRRSYEECQVSEEERLYCIIKGCSYRSHIW